MAVRTLGIVIAAIVGVIGFAGCGGLSKPTAQVGIDPGVKFAACMRAHGLRNFPDPGSSGAVQIGGAGLNPASPAFQAAQKACGGAQGGPGQISMTESQRLKAIAFAKCMRTHGEPDWPDPVLSAPAGGGPVLALHGMFFSMPANFNPTAPGVRMAAGDCGVTLPPVGGKGRVVAISKP
ncbi:MAG TPA: hypothetical protein VMD48_08910 [Solirubrobacteraceae bacterium]|nr:hypothetical protein [Solirubrobacteraceae bacterium]